jgi:hypothetical protein
MDVNEAQLRFMRSRLAIMLPLVVLVAGLAGCSTGSDTSTAARQEQVRQAGASVMPFDLDKTQHSFVKTDDGGVQTVLAIDSADEDQVRLVREHLSEIRGEFAAGQYDDPMAIHGMNMPGVQALAAGADRIQITYGDVDGGGELTYRTTDASLVNALHDWFDAQVADHGSDAVTTPLDHAMTEDMSRQHHPGEPYPGATDGQ